MWKARAHQTWAIPRSTDSWPPAIGGRRSAGVHSPWKRRMRRCPAAAGSQPLPARPSPNPRTFHPGARFPSRRSLPFGADGAEPPIAVCRAIQPGIETRIAPWPKHRHAFRSARGRTDRQRPDGNPAAPDAGPTMAGRSCPLLDLASAQGSVPAEPASRLDGRPDPAGRTRPLPLCPNLISSSCSHVRSKNGECDI